MLRPVGPVSFPQLARRALCRHRAKAACLFVLVMGGVTAAVVLGPRAYTSESKLLVRLGRENVTLDPTATFGQPPVVAVPTSRENDINSVIEVVRSRVLLEKVVDALGPGVVLGEEPLSAGAAEPAGAEAKARRYLAVRALGRLLTVEAVKHSNVIDITCEGPSPDVAQAVVTKLVDLSLDYHAQLNRTPQAPRFLAEQADRLRKELAHSEADLKDLKDKTGLTAPDGQRQALVARVARLEDELLQTTATVPAAEAEVRLLRQRLAELPKTETAAHTTGFPNQAADTMRAQLYALQVEESKLLAKYRPQSPEVQQLRKQVAVAREILDREERAREQVTVSPSRSYEDVRLALLKQEPALAALKAKALALQGQLDREREALRAFNTSQLVVGRQQRIVDLQESLYRKYAESLEQAQIDQALTQQRISNISIVQPATFELKPIRPRVGRTLALGFAFAVLSSLGLALAAEYLGGVPEGEATPALVVRENGRPQTMHGVS